MSRQSSASTSQTSAATGRIRGSASGLLAEPKRDSRISTSNNTRLIVTADDFGISPEVNEAVIRAYREGVLTSASLMVTGAAFDQAVALARQNPGLAVGIHLVTVVGRSVLSHSEIRTLVDERGEFSNNSTRAGLRYYFSPQARRELRKELAAQFEKFHSTGLPLSHIDGHLHLHVHPVIFNAAIELGKKYGCRRMRVPVEERRLALAFDRADVFRKTIHALLFGGLAIYMKRKLTAQGFSFADRVYGNLQSGRMSERYALYAIDNLQGETNEIYFHPAVYAYGRQLTPADRQCSIEFEALISARVRDRIEQLGVKLTNHLD